MFSGKQKDRATYQISNHEFRDYFMKLSDPGDEFFQPNADIRDELNDWLSQELECAFVELNCDISEYEVKLAISQLKSGKSGGEDMLLNELFVYGKDVLLNTFWNCLTLYLILGSFQRHGVMVYSFRCIKKEATVM